VKNLKGKKFNILTRGRAFIGLIILTFTVVENEIVLIDIGHHDEVY